MTKSIILEMSPIAFGVESDLGNTGITRSCRETLIALDRLLLDQIEERVRYYVFSSSSRWHNQLLINEISNKLCLKSFYPLMDICDLTVASNIHAFSKIISKPFRGNADSLLQNFEFLGDACKQFLSSNEFIYLTSYLPTPSYVRSNARARVVHQINDLFPLTRPSLFHGGIDELWKKKAADFLPDDHYICISNATASDLKYIFPYIHESHISVVHLAGDHALRTTTRETCNAVVKYGLDTSPFFITVSTLEPRKNLPFLLRAFREYKKRYPSNHQLVCIGATGWMKDAEHKFIDELSSAGDIRFLGRLSDEETFNLVQHATSYISTARCEGFGLGLAEAMSLGCLPIAARNTSQVEVVEGIGILYESFDELIDALLTAANVCYSKPDIQSKALARFQWRRSADSIHNILLSVADDK